MGLQANQHRVAEFDRLAEAPSLGKAKAKRAKSRQNRTTKVRGVFQARRLIKISTLTNALEKAAKRLKRKGGEALGATRFRRGRRAACGRQH
jgi:hypothetical protein